MPSVVRNKISNPASEPDLQRASTFPPNKQLQPSNGSSSNQRHATYPNQPFPPDPLYSDSNSLQNSDTSMIDNIGIDFNLFSFANSNLGPFIPGYNIPDLAAIMFPSADPFAYPNQPMTTLENHTGFSSSDSQAPNTITNTVGASTTISSPDLNLYGGLPLRESSSSGSGLEAQLLDPLQPYLTIDYGQGLNAGGSGGFNPEMGLGSISNSVKDEFSGNEQEQKQEQQQQHQQQWWGQINNGEAMVYDPI